METMTKEEKWIKTKFNPLSFSSTPLGEHTRKLCKSSLPPADVTEYRLQEGKFLCDKCDREIERVELDKVCFDCGRRCYQRQT